MSRYNIIKASSFDEVTFLAGISQPQKKELARLILNNEPIPSKFGSTQIAEMRDKIKWAKRGEQKYCETCSIASLV